jgi:hypothetical protein
MAILLRPIFPPAYVTNKVSWNSNQVITVWCERQLCGCIIEVVVMTLAGLISDSDGELRD